MRPIRSLCLATCATLLLSGTVLAQGNRPAPARNEPRFDILEFVVEGDTLLGAAVIERTVYPFLGPQRGVADAESARKALEKAYHDAGYLSVNVVLPPQRVGDSGGELRLQVVQAGVDKLRITGAQFFLPGDIRQAVPSLRPGSVPNFNEMQQELGDVARASADREITPLIAAGEKPGTMNVELKVQDSLPLHGSIELNNKQSQNTEPGRLEAGLSYDNLFQRGHSLGWTWFYSPKRPSEANIHTLTYHLPLGGPGDRLFLSLQHSDSDTPTALGGSTVSRGETWRLRWRDQLAARPGVDHALSWGLAWRQLRDLNRSVAGFDTATPELRYPSFSAGYELDLSGAPLGGLAGRSTRLQADLNFGLPGLGSRSVDCSGTQLDQFACKRTGASAGFQVLSLTLNHREPFGRWALSARLQGQYTDTPLVPAEQASYGGVDSVRGYHDGALSTDVGVAARLELLPPAWQALSALSLRPLVFYDEAIGRRLEALPGEVARGRLASTGLGLRVESAIGLQATLHWSEVLRGSGRGRRLDFSLRQAF